MYGDDAGMYGGGGGGSVRGMCLQRSRVYVCMRMQALENKCDTQN